MKFPITKVRPAVCLHTLIALATRAALEADSTSQISKDQLNTFGPLYNTTIVCDTLYSLDFYLPDLTSVAHAEKVI